MYDNYDYVNLSRSNFTVDPPKTFEQFLKLSQMASTFAGRIIGEIRWSLTRKFPISLGCW